MKISSEFIFLFSWWLDRARQIAWQKMRFKLKIPYRKESMISLSSYVAGNRPETLIFENFL